MNAAIGSATDPAGESPWAMQIVLRMERVNPASRVELCQAAGIAVARILDDERALSDGEWGESFKRWSSGRIRKHCRRARGIAWERAQELPGVTASSGRAEARAFVPSPVDAIPSQLAKLQLSGSEPPESEPTALAHSEALVVVSVCPEPFLPLGKAAGAVGHAAQIARAEMDEMTLDRWRKLGFDLAVEQPSVAVWRTDVKSSRIQVVDGGLTVVTPGTTTAVARWDDAQA